MGHEWGFESMKIKLFLAALFVALPCLGSGLENKEITYPFANNPKLSFAEFEKEFRKKYGHLDIPKIDLTKDLHQSPAAYHTIMKYLLVNPQLVHYSGYHPETVEFLLLHEAGHHNYPQAKKEENLQRANDVLKTTPKIIEDATWGLKSLEKSLMVANGYKILRYKPNIKLLAAQLFVSKAATSLMPTILNSYRQNRFEYERMRSEEIAADQFAIQHGNSKALQSFDKNFLSSDSFLKLQEAAHINQRKNACQEFGDRLGNVLSDATSRGDRALEKLRQSYSWVHNLIDPAHPSNKDRSAMIQQELQRRNECAK